MKIPKSLSDCLLGSQSAANIFEWATRIENYGLGCMVCILVGGLIISILNGKDYYGDFSFLLFFTQYIVWIVAAIIEFFFYKFFASILEGLSCIIDNTTISAKISAYEANLHEIALDKEIVTSNTGVDNISQNIALKQSMNSHKWLCDKCNKMINQYPCKYCGYDAHDKNEVIANIIESKDQKKKVPVPVHVGSDGQIVCPICKCEQKSDREVCWECGQPFIKD